MLTHLTICLHSLCFSHLKTRAFLKTYKVKIIIKLTSLQNKVTEIFKYYLFGAVFTCGLCHISLTGFKLCKSCWFQLNMAILNKDSMHSLYTTGTANRDFCMGSILQRGKKHHIIRQMGPLRIQKGKSLCLIKEKRCSQSSPLISGQRWTFLLILH